PDHRVRFHGSSDGITPPVLPSMLRINTQVTRFDIAQCPGLALFTRMQDVLKQQHQTANENAKQVFTCFVSWYTFFWTLNAGALGWLYSPQAMLSGNNPAFFKGRMVLSVIFGLLNCLGIGAC